MKKSEKELLERFRRLSEEDAATLLAFAEFLAGRAAPGPREIPAPTPTERPANESVVGALKRLSASYHMLDKAKILNETSTLVAQHVMQGRDVIEVIDELEIVFHRHYERLVEGGEKR